MTNSASGFDELPGFIMKQCSKLYAKPYLCHVFLVSIRQGLFPTKLKLAKVLALYNLMINSSLKTIGQSQCGY